MLKVYSLAKDGNINLTNNFKVREFRCKDGSDQILVHTELVDILQKLRNRYGRPVNINSAYRTKTYNDAIGGARNSNHITGEAADIYIGESMNHMPEKLVAMFLESIGVKSIIVYTYGTKWIHVGSNEDGKFKIETAKGVNRTYTTFLPTLKRQYIIYTNKEEVKILQEILRNKGLYYDKIDGKFSANTFKALVRFQAKNKLTPNGVCDKATWTKILA